MKDTIDPERNDSEKVLELYRTATKSLSLREQWYAAEMIAMNLGYTLQPEEKHPDSPHAAPRCSP